jgi:Holliday junction resolvase
MTMKRVRAELSAAVTVALVPAKWSEKEIERDVRQSKLAFIGRREAETTDELSPYTQEFDKALIASGKVISVLPKILPRGLKSETLALVFEKEESWTVMRYLAGPPISKDDLETLSNGRKITAKTIRASRATAMALSKLLDRWLDRSRFSWITEKRNPTKAELNAAIKATAFAIAVQRTQTGRRKLEKSSLEGGITELLNGMGFKRVATLQTGMATMRDAPKAGTYFSACNIGKHNADFVIGLMDGRVLAIECKASNSELNSRKRVSKEAERDVAHWAETFGKQVIAAIVLRGVFAPSMIQEAEAVGLSVFWEHRLNDLQKFLVTTSRMKKAS